MESEIKAFDAACLWQIFGKTRLEEWKSMIIRILHLYFYLNYIFMSKKH